MSDAIVREILERVLRVESRLVRLADGLKIDVRSKTKCRVSFINEYPVLEVTGTDISLSQLISICKERGILGILVDIHFDNRVVGSVQT